MPGPFAQSFLLSRKNEDTSLTNPSRLTVGVGTAGL